MYDLDPEAVARLTSVGAKAAKSPCEVGDASEVVVTMLPEAQHVRKVVLGPHGVSEGLKKGGVVIDMSTIDPYTSQEVGVELTSRWSIRRWEDVRTCGYRDAYADAGWRPRGDRTRAAGPELYG